MKASRSPDLSVNLGGVAMKNPVAVASGTFGYGREYAQLLDISRLGAVTVKGLRLAPHAGNPLPRHAEVRGGMVNAVGLQGVGVEAFIQNDLPFLREKNVPVIVNIWGTSGDEYAAVAERLDGVDGVSALEINISCPNVKEGGASFGARVETAAALVQKIRARVKLPLIPKLAPNVPDIRPFARAMEDAGADAVSLINTIPAMVINIETRRPVLANRAGGLSGPAIHPVAVKLVYDAAQAVKIPILAMGGVMEARDAIEFMLAGASAVAVGTANFIDPRTALRVVDGIAEYMRRHGFASAKELTGSVVPP